MKKLLILDLDETLLLATDIPLVRPADFRIGECHVYLRPYLSEFIDGVKGMFDLAIWTASGEGYARQIVDRIFTPGSLRFFWTSKRCTLIKDHERGGYQTRKHLKKVKRQGYSFESILVVDDTPTNYERSLGNLITVRPFSGDPSDDELRLLLGYLNVIKDVQNVRLVDKRNWQTRV